MRRGEIGTFTRREKHSCTILTASWTHAPSEAHGPRGTRYRRDRGPRSRYASSTRLASSVRLVFQLLCRTWQRRDVAEYPAGWSPRSWRSAVGKMTTGAARVSVRALPRAAAGGPAPPRLTCGAECARGSRLMASAQAPLTHRGRSATRAVLRALASLVALLLTLSSLGQVAHFALVPHAICAEHGELVELSERASHVAASHAEPASNDRTRAAAPEQLSEHDHCQVLARGQREQALPASPAPRVLPPTAAGVKLAAAPQTAGFQRVSALSLAPKTSPPCSPSA